MSKIEKYSGLAIILHWLIALLIGLNICLGLLASRTPASWERPMIDLHKSFGILVLGLFIVRVVWRLTHKPPPFPDTITSLEQKAAQSVHVALYILMFALPVSGWIHDSAWSAAISHPMKIFWIIPWFRLGFITDLDPTTKDTVHTLFGDLHDYFGYALYVVLGLHILGALKHQFIDKQPEIQRMWR